MKTKVLDIGERSYEIREITMEEGMPLISAGDGNVDLAGLIRASVRINGKRPKEGEISMGDAMKLMPLVMELNNFNTGEAGNG